MRADLIRAISAFDRREWMSGALCAQVDPDLHFPDTGGGGQPIAREAKRICRSCPVQRPCLEYGLDDEHGIYAGLTPHQRRPLLRDKRKKGEL